MTLITLRCKNCGSGMTIDPNSKTATCTHCGSTFLMIELLDEKDMSFSKLTSAEDIQQRIDFAEALKQGETYLYQAEYKKAEECFKRAIQLCDTSHKGYFGVVKAKTHNLNLIPDDDSYREFAKYALKYVDIDDSSYLKNELSKLDFLAQEKHRIIKEKELLQEKAQQHQKNLKDTERFWGKIAQSMVLLITLVLLIAIIITYQESRPWKNLRNTYYITSIADFNTYSENDDFLESRIILKQDLNFNDASWKPIGTKDKPFSGEFNGNNHTISNLNLSVGTISSLNFLGLFGYIDNARIRNLSINNISILDSAVFNENTTNYIGFICGFANNSIINRCQVNNSNALNVNYSKNTSLCVGGIVGESTNSTIQNSYSNAKIKVKALNLADENNNELNMYMGGIVGKIDNCKLDHCYSASNIETEYTSYSTIQLTTYTSGLIGYNKIQNSNTISNSYFAGNINNTIEALNYQEYIAGIIAYGANYDKLSAVFSLFDDNFIFNDDFVNKRVFHDQSLHQNTVVYCTKLELTYKIKEIFHSSVWDSTSSPLLTLK